MQWAQLVTLATVAGLVLALLARHALTARRHRRILPLLKQVPSCDVLSTSLLARSAGDLTAQQGWTRRESFFLSLTTGNTSLYLTFTAIFPYSQQPGPGPGPGPGAMLLSPAELLRVGSPGRAGEKIITEEGVSAGAGQQGGVSDRGVVHAPAVSPVLEAARPLTPPYQAGRLVRQVGRVALFIWWTASDCRCGGTTPGWAGSTDILIWTDSSTRQAVSTTICSSAHSIRKYQLTCVLFHLLRISAKASWCKIIDEQVDTFRTRVTTPASLQVNQILTQSTELVLPALLAGRVTCETDRQETLLLWQSECFVPQQQRQCCECWQ